MKHFYLVLFLVFGSFAGFSQSFNIRTDSGWDTTNLCSGTLYDNGGSANDYSTYSYGYFVIDPPGPEAVSIDFTQFDLGWGDYFYVYDGVGTSNYLGGYWGTTLPNSGNAITSTAGAMTIYFTSNYSGTGPGFAMNWSTVSTAAPNSSFTVSNNNPAFNTEVAFTNTTTNGAISEWHFGDGTTSAETSPVHKYTTSGSFNAYLINTNCLGADTSISQSITVQTAPTFTITPDTLTSTANCGNTVTGSFDIAHTGGGTLNYDIEAQEAGVSPYVFREDFENGLGGFSVDPIASSGFTGSAQQGTAALGTGYASISGFTGTHDGIFASFPSSQPTGISFRVNLSSSTYSNYITIGDSPEINYTDMVYARLYGSGQIRFYTWFGSYYFNLNLNQWNQVELKNIDWTNHTFDLWINGVEEQTALSFNNISTNSVNEMHMWSSNSVGSSYDEIEIFATQPVPVTVVPSNGVLSSSNTNTISVTTSTSGMIAGSYQYDLLVSTNGSGSDTLVTIPWMIDVVGAPDMAFDKSCLDFDSVYQNLVYSDSIQIVNTGCDTLDITSIVSTTGDISLSSNALIVEPFDTSYLYVDFTPTAISNYTDTLYLYNNQSDTIICISAVSQGAPVVGTDSSAYTINVTGCVDSVPFGFDIINSGLSDLKWNINAGPSARFFDDFENGFNSNLWSYHGSNSINSSCSVYSGSSAINFQGNTRQIVTNYINMAVGDSITFWAASGKSSYPCEWPDGGENLILEYSTNGISWFNIGTVFSSDPDQFYRFVSPVTASMQIRIIQYSYTGSTYDNYTVDDFRIGGAAASDGNFNPNSGTTASNDTTSVNGFFNTQDLLNGTHTRTVVVTSNDPIDSIYSFDVTININGVANIVYPTSCLDMDSLVAGNTALDSVLIYNDGCSDLVISSFATATSDFNILSSTATLAPDDSMYVYVQFQPSSANLGALTDTLSIASNDTLAKVCLAGFAKGAPLISLDTSAINVTINSCNDSVLVQRTIYNNGQGPLNFKVGGSGQTSGLQEVLDTFKNAYTDVTAQIPTIYNFSEGIFGSSISDGGGDMYDGGNTILVDNTILSYSQDLIQSSTALGPNGEYFTYKGTGIWLFAADLDGANNFRISGNLGADGWGSVSATTLSRTVSGVNYTGFVKRVYSAGDPSINHLIIIEDDPGVTRTHLTSTGTENHNLNGLGNTTRLYYLLYAGSGGAFIDDAATQNIMNTFLDLVHDAGRLSDWITVTPDSAMVAVNDSSVLDIWVKTTGLSSGTHTGNIDVSTDDPLHPILNIPVVLTLNGVPEIEVDTTSCISFSNVLQGAIETDTIWIYNGGCDTLRITGTQNSLSDFSIANTLPINVEVGDSLPLIVEFSPVTVGTFTDTLEIQNNDASKFICLDGTSLGAPLITLQEDSLVVEVNKCHIIQTETYQIDNIGQGVLEYDLRIGEYQSSNIETYNISGAITTHSFKNTPTLADTIEVDVILHGDFASGFTWQNPTLYINGNYYSTIYDSNLDMQDDTISLLITGTNASFYTNNDSIQFSIYNPSSVPGTAGSFHKIDVRIVSNTNWVAVTGSNTGPVAANASKTHNMLFNTAGLAVGRYSTTMGIASNQVNDAFVNVPVVMYVISEEKIELSDTCLNFASTFINDTATQNLVIYNTGCEALSVSSILNTNPVFQLSQTSGTIAVDDSLVITVDFLPTSPGNYSGSFIINNSDTTQIVCVNGIAVAKPIAGFIPFEDNACLGKFIFQDTSNYSPTGWQWDFGDGNLSTSSSPTHFYQKPGTYKVILTAINVNGFDTTSVWVSANPLFGDFTMSTDTALVDSIVSFSDSSVTGTSWLWNFDDGTTDTLQNPTHSFSVIGRYDVKLTVTDSRGCTIDITKTLRVISDIGLYESALSSVNIDVYPNPADDWITVNFDQSAVGILNEVAITLVDASGKILMEGISLNENSKTIDVSKYPAGMYLVHITRSGQVIASKKVVIEK